MSTAQQSDPRGEALVRELLWVHDALRHDLAIVTRMADEVIDGMQVEDVSAQIQSLSAASPIWALRVNCLHYCRFVHLHHRIESAHLFPAVKASDPALGPVVDRLDAEHDAVSRTLNDVEAAVEQLVAADDPEHRKQVAAALRSLAEGLLSHLDYEEENLVPVLRTWSGWPRWAGGGAG